MTVETLLEDDALRIPGSPREMFRVFNALALQGFGGVLPVAQRVLVERQRWLSKTEFLELLSISQVLPGPNIINMSIMIGHRFFGWRGAVAATAGMLVMPLLIVLALAALFSQFSGIPAVAGALRGMGVVAAGLIVYTAVKLGAALRANTMGLPICLGYGGLTLLAVGWLRWPMVWVVLGLGALAIATAWVKLRP
ncbi:MAG: chromate transporter [Rubrivivax sp.]|nr:chromate transporter [Rubrivivax sp.]